ncbi:hypothetical protein Pf1_00008 [Flavobacterium columnare]|nr:hypothetical protein Pf1_00008 [Flavobacterium columnare]
MVKKTPTVFLPFNSYSVLSNERGLWLSEEQPIRNKFDDYNTIIIKG